MSTSELARTPRPARRTWPVVLHAPLVALLTVSVLLTDDRAQTWTRLSELLLSVAGLPLSFVAGSFLAFSPVPVQGWVLDAVPAVAVLATVFAISTRGRPVLAGTLVGGGAYVAVCAPVALNASLWVLLAVPLAVLGGIAVTAAAWTGSAPRRPWHPRLTRP